MTIVRMSRLSEEDLALLGNNLAPRRRKRRPLRQLQAVNRSLATLGERVSSLDRFAGSTFQRPRLLSA